MIRKNNSAKFEIWLLERKAFRVPRAADLATRTNTHSPATGNFNQVIIRIVYSISNRDAVRSENGDRTGDRTVSLISNIQIFSPKSECQYTTGLVRIFTFSLLLIFSSQFYSVSYSYISVFSLAIKQINV